MSSPSQPPPDPLLGTLLDGKYRVVRLIGAGGMGAVYEGRHEAINRRVAIKVLLPQMAGDARVKQRFINEARIGGELGQENIVEVTDLGELPSGAPYLVMEFLEGWNLAQFVREQGPLPIEIATEIVGRVLEALVAVHRRGVIHRDLKPANVFLAQSISPTGRKKVVVKILDFGISKLQAPDDPELTQDGARMGSPAFMSPEQAKNTKYTTHLSDIYSAGALLYTALTARPPFVAGSTNEILLAVMTEPVASPRQHRPELPVSLEQIVLKAMAREPEQRYQTAEEFLAALEPFVPGQSTLADGLQAPSLSEPTTLPFASFGQSSLAGAEILPKQSSPSRRLLWLLAGMLALLLVAGVAVVWHLAGQSSAEPVVPEPELIVARSQPDVGAIPSPAPVPMPRPPVEPPTPPIVKAPPVEPPAPTPPPAVPGVKGKRPPAEPGIDEPLGGGPGEDDGETPEPPTPPAPSYNAAAVRAQARQRLNTVRGAVATCVGNRPSTVRCSINVNGRTGEARSVTVSIDPASSRASVCVRAVVSGVSFPRFDDDSLSVRHTFRVASGGGE